MSKKGFTLIELLIVVAIIAILAAIAVPNFLEAQVRSKVARVQTDMRSVAIALESYFVDNNDYPAWAATNALDTAAVYTVNVNSGLGDSDDCGATNLRSFAINPLTDPADNLFTLTTPTGYITTLPADPFRTTKGATFAYFKDVYKAGWIMWSVGPDIDEGDGHLDDLNDYVETIYSPFVSQPTLTLLTAGSGDDLHGAYNYDPTNGTSSQGSIFRVKQ